ncbi:MAG: hypothetical protein M3414_07040 [Pseudomonadota bacterium]|nr:hypothetical protein [Pseudomonadota bacterium]
MPPSPQASLGHCLRQPRFTQYTRVRGKLAVVSIWPLLLRILLTVGLMTHGPAVASGFPYAVAHGAGSHMDAVPVAEAEPAGAMSDCHERAVEAEPGQVAPIAPGEAPSHDCCVSCDGNCAASSAVIADARNGAMLAAHGEISRLKVVRHVPPGSSLLIRPPC